MRFKLYISLFLTALVVNGCQKDIDVFVLDPGQINGPDTNWVTVIGDGLPVSLLKKELQVPLQADSFEINNSAATVLLSSGLKCDFPVGSLLDPSNNPLTGTIRVEAALLKTRGDVIRMNRPTIADGKLLVSGGIINIRVTNSNSEVALNQGEGIYLTCPVTGTYTANKLFFGEEAFPGSFNWVKYNNDSQGALLSSTNQEYKIKCRRAGWISPAMLFESSAATTNVSAKLPAHFTNANTSVYLVFRDMFSVAALNPDLASRKFISTSVPAGVPVTMVVISRQGNDYYLGHADATSAIPSTGSSTQQIASNPVKVSFEKLNLYLSSL